AKDSLGNTVTAFDGGGNKVTLTSTGALTGAPLTSAAFTLGVLTQSVTITNAGNFNITATGPGAVPKPTGISNNFDVNAPCTSPSVTTQPISQGVAYGVANVSFTAAASGSPAPTVQWQVSTNGGGSFSDVGGATSTTLTINNPTVAMSGNQYHAVFTNSCTPATATSTAATLTVNRAHLTVTADDKSRAYGAANPTFTAMITGFVGTDTVAVVNGSPTFSGTGPSSTATTTVGNYVITPALGTLSAANYDFTTFNNGTLAINPVTATVAGTVNRDVVNYTPATTALQFSNVVNYPITVTLGSNPYYTVTSTNGTLAVNPGTATVKADDKNKFYGDVNPALTATVTGTVNGDVLNYTLATTALRSEERREGKVSGSLGSNPNYTVTSTDGTLTVNPRPATVKADDKNKPYGDLNPALTATVTGTVNGDVLNYTLSTTALQFSNVSNYPITVNLGSNPNYDVTPTDGTLTVNKKAISHT